MGMGNAAPEFVKSTAQIVSPLLGRIVGGLVADRHENGEVTILFAGMRKRGRPLSLDDILKIEGESQTQTADQGDRA